MVQVLPTLNPLNVWLHTENKGILFLYDFFNLLIHSIVTPWMMPCLCPGHVCIVGNLWGTRDLGFTDASPQSFCWCHLALKLKCAILAVFKFKHDLGFIDLCWLLCVIMVVVGDQALGGRLYISNYHTGSTVVWCGSCFAMERLTAACVCTNLMLLTSLSMNLHLVTIRHINIFRSSSEMFKTFKPRNFMVNL